MYILHMYMYLHYITTVSVLMTILGAYVICMVCNRVTYIVNCLMRELGKNDFLLPVDEHIRKYEIVGF